MKKLFVAIMVLMMIAATAAVAESGVPFSEWIKAFETPAEEAVVQDEQATDEGEALLPEAAIVPVFTSMGVGSRGDDVVQLQTKLIELGVLNGKADGIWGPKTDAAVKYTQKALGWEETGVITSVDELNTIMGIAPGDGVNLAVGTSDEWSEWMTPEYCANNRTFTVAYAFPGAKQVGDFFTCQIEIEFFDVSAIQGNEDQKFKFYTQGSVDGVWDIGNIWDGKLIYLNEVPVSGIYRYTATSAITEKNVDAIQFDIGFRCDYWASGSFRVRKIKVEKGIAAFPWSISPTDVGDGINIAVGTSSEWSEWMMPKYDAENMCFTVAYAYPGEKKTGDTYTCQLEIEFSNVTEIQGNEDHKFRFWTQGAVDGSWKKRNIWIPKLVDMYIAPLDGVYKYTCKSFISADSVDAEVFDIGFRCDYWASGAFRVRNIKIEKGTTATDWTPAPPSTSLN